MSRKSRMPRKSEAGNSERPRRSVPVSVGTYPRRFERLEHRRLLDGKVDFSLLAGDLQTALSTVQTSVATAVNLAPSIPILARVWETTLA